MTQPSTLPAESLFKGFIRAYYVGTHTADVQLAASPSQTIDGVRVATHIHAADAVVDRECTVLFFGAANCQDAVVIGVQGALPSAPGGGVTDHGLLDAPSLLHDDHPQYALLAGRAGGQTLIGDTATGAHLTLQSTAHATRGYVRAQDDVQLLSGYLRDSAANARIQLATASPHVTLTGNVRVSDTLGVGTPPTTNSALLATISTAAAAGVIGGNFTATNTNTSGARNVFGLYGGAYTGATGSGTNQAYGLYFAAYHNSPNTCNRLEAIHVTLYSNVACGAITIGLGINVTTAAWAGTLPTTTTGIRIEDQAGAGVTTAYGLQITNQTATNVYLIEAMSAVSAAPYFRVVGGAAPAANNTHVWVAEGVTPTLRNLRWKLYSALVAGDRVCVLV